MHTCMHTQVDCPGMAYPRSLQGPRTNMLVLPGLSASASEPTCAEHTEHGAALPSLADGSLPSGF